ncbi:TetR/AcrR family transcriptional regulator [Kangiella shandongensis]|uniref:TetR/AcrR family transcriptional regulator n=1 Tax=Kangiella shandongensis TaxID=2763258 RepID=UPI001CBD7FDE|nr:TetR/AcrR family transcriptional regulator [Kangiella shandongensis]
MSSNVSKVLGSTMVGRQRTFEKSDALASAMKVFWQKGYSGTSLSDLTAAMGINKPSLYTAFGNKEKLFISALEQYVCEYGSPHAAKLLDRQFGLKQRVRLYLESIVEKLLDSDLPKGCFVMTSTCEAESDCLPEEAMRKVRSINHNSRSELASFFQEELKKGELNSTASPDELADFLLTIQFGLAVMARSRASHERLQRVINYATQSF